MLQKLKHLLFGADDEDESNEESNDHGGIFYPVSTDAREVFDKLEKYEQKYPSFKPKTSSPYLDSQRDYPVVGFKAVRDGVVVLLIAPEEKIVCPTNGRKGNRMRKYRTQRAKVMDIIKVRRAKYPAETADVSISEFDRHFKYKKGEYVETELDPSPEERCSNGIHFFKTPSEAVSWGDFRLTIDQNL